MSLPSGFQDTISDFSSAFRKDVWPKVQLLLTGAIICPGSRTICNLLRSVGLRWEKNFPKFHRVLSHDKWSAYRLSGVLLGLTINRFVPKGECLVFGLDDTIERRWGPKISKRGIYRDPVRSSKSHFVKCSGLRWLSLMVLAHLPWLRPGVCWALPVLTVLCPSERFYTAQGRPVKKLTDWAAQVLSWLGRKCAGLERPVYLTGDGSFATFELFARAQQVGVGMIARMKLNSRLYHLPPKHYPAGKRGPRPPVGKRLLGMGKRVADKRTKWRKVVFSEWYGRTDKEMMITSGVAIWRESNKMLIKVKWVLVKDPEGKLEPALLGCTDFGLADEKVVTFLVRRWRVEVTFEEVRRHLGVETQRQWSDLAIDRTTPCLMTLFSIVCLWADKLNIRQPLQPNASAWYQKKHITFSGALAAVRLEILRKTKFSISDGKTHMESYSDKIRHLRFLLTQAVA
ncbi:MAG: transposase [Proteobacteria bacterium]|nr:transposase [Pseudomonadota bacterium]